MLKLKITKLLDKLEFEYKDSNWEHRLDRFSTDENLILKNEETKILANTTEILKGVLYFFYTDNKDHLTFSLMRDYENPHVLPLEGNLIKFILRRDIDVEFLNRTINCQFSFLVKNPKEYILPSSRTYKVYSEAVLSDIDKPSEQTYAWLENKGVVVGVITGFPPMSELGGIKYHLKLYNKITPETFSEGHNFEKKRTEIMWKPLITMIEFIKEYLIS